MQVRPACGTHHYQRPHRPGGAHLQTRRHVDAQLRVLLEPLRPLLDDDRRSVHHHDTREALAGGLLQRDVERGDRSLAEPGEEHLARRHAARQLLRLRDELLEARAALGEAGRFLSDELRHLVRLRKGRARAWTHGGARLGQNSARCDVRRARVHGATVVTARRRALSHCTRRRSDIEAERGLTSLLASNAMKPMTSSVHQALPITVEGACGKIHTIFFAASDDSKSDSHAGMTARSVFVAPRPCSTTQTRSAALAPLSTSGGMVTRQSYPPSFLVPFGMLGTEAAGFGGAALSFSWASRARARRSSLSMQSANERPPSVMSAFSSLSEREPTSESAESAMDKDTGDVESYSVNTRSE
eukprot:6827153-Prymnesium_polylepis.1